jgi:hypothetical protein
MNYSGFFVTLILVVVGIEVLLKLNNKNRKQLTILDRILGGGFYLLPLFELVKDNLELLKDTGIPQSIWFREILFYYNIIPYLNYILFFGSYFVLIYYRVVPMSYFVRYNIMQGLLIFIASSLVTSLYYTAFTFSTYETSSSFINLFFNSIIQYIFTSITIGTAGVLVYCIISSIFGKYSKIPFISDSLVWHIGDKEK